MKHFLLIYDLTPDYLDRRPEFRGAHLALAWAAAERGDLLMGGALADPTDTAMLLFTTAEAAQAFAATDPYVTHGLVRSWKVREWMTVAGEMAANPVKP